MVYCHPKANVDNAYSVLTDHTHELEENSPDVPIIITGDFNECRLNASLPNFHQFVNVPTRKDRTLDLCYCNVTEAYRVRRLPPLGSSDHCMLQLLPLYRQKFRREKAKRIQVKKWDADSVDMLKGCMDCNGLGCLYKIKCKCE